MQCYPEVYESADMCQVKCLDFKFECTMIGKKTHQCCKPVFDDNIKIVNKAQDMGFPLSIVVVVALVCVTVLLAGGIIATKNELKQMPEYSVGLEANAE